MNPWQEAHAANEAAFQDGDPQTARRVVANEYADAPPPVLCTKRNCNGQAFYKATIGCLKCTQCGALYWCDGDPLD